MVRRINKEGFELVKQWEGLKLTAYRPLSHDVWTIGYGHTSAAGMPQVFEGMAITKDEAITILHRDLAKFERVVEDAVKVPLTDNQFSALVSLAFNIGGTAFKNSTLVKKLNKMDYEGAQDQFDVWRKSGGKVVKGLVNRRKQEAALFGRGEFVTSSYVEAKAETPKILTKENITFGATTVAGLGVAGESLMTGNGPVQIALAVVIVGGALLLAAFALYNHFKAK